MNQCSILLFSNLGLDEVFGRTKKPIPCVTKNLIIHHGRSPARHIPWGLQCVKHGLGQVLDAVFLLPVKDLVEIDTFAHDVEVGEGWLALLVPAKSDELDAGLAHEPVGQRFLTMGEVRAVGGRIAVREVNGVVVVQALAHRVEAVQQVHPRR